MAVVLPSANGSILEEIEFEGRVGGKTKVEFKFFCKKKTTNTEKEGWSKNPRILFGGSSHEFSGVVSCIRTCNIWKFHEI